MDMDDDRRERLRQSHQDTVLTAVIELGEVLDRLRTLHFKDERVPEQRDDKHYQSSGRGQVGFAEDLITQAIYHLRRYRDGKPMIDQGTFAPLQIVKRSDSGRICASYGGRRVVFELAVPHFRTARSCNVCLHGVPMAPKMWVPVNGERTHFTFYGTRIPFLLCADCAVGTTELLKSTRPLI